MFRWRWVAVVLILASFVTSYRLIFIGIAQEVTNIPGGGGIPEMLIGFFLFGINLFTIQATGELTHWHDIPAYKKLIAAITMLIPILVSSYIILLIMVFSFVDD